ncbi:unnamed protein product [Fraxinus pennsylvanica]|uniref:Uncharacterized protein n=1 Tax=Fraxinus pennsylvanica TaxID=56036 RepID=A0AAD1ZPW1_9LAMI|nr:unnamed protein product [Fraxinus pennsylvanica]
MVARVDPLVNMDQITRVTVLVNLALVVVAEVDDLTLVVLLMAMGWKEVPTFMAFSLILMGHSDSLFLLRLSLYILGTHETYKTVVSNLKDLAKDRGWRSGQP